MMRNPWVPGLLLAATLLVAATIALSTSYPDVPSGGQWWRSYPALARGLGIARGFPVGESRCPPPPAQKEGVTAITMAITPTPSGITPTPAGIPPVGGRVFCPDTPATRAEGSAMTDRGVAAAVVLSGLLAWLIATLVAQAVHHTMIAEIAQLRKELAAAKPAGIASTNLWLPHRTTTPDPDVPDGPTEWVRHY